MNAALFLLLLHTGDVSAGPIVSCGALAHLADYRAGKSLADCVSELQIGSFAVIAGLSDCSADQCLASVVSAKHLADR